MPAKIELPALAVLIFFRSEGFYIIDAVHDVDLTKQATDNALLNPGTLRVEDGLGSVLWEYKPS